MKQEVLLNTCFEYSGPAAVRYPRGSGCGAKVNKEFLIVEIGKGKKIKMAKKYAF